MKTLKPVKRHRLPRALKAENVISAGEATGLLPFLPEDSSEEENARNLYCVHKARRD